MGATAMYGLSYPDPGDLPDGPAALQALAEDVEALVASPAGSTAYDTGWLTTGLTAQAAVTSAPTSYAYRRIGNLVAVYANNFTASITNIGTDGNCDNINLFQMPTTDWYPTQEQGGIGNGSTGALCSCIITTGGYLRVTAVSAQSTATGSVNRSLSMSLGGIYFLG